MNRRRVLHALALSPWMPSAPFARTVLAAADPKQAPSPLEQALVQVLPPGGYRTRIALGESVVKLADEGVIERAKFEALYARSGKLSEELKSLLGKPSRQPISLTRESAALYVNLLWPLGLANRMGSNALSPLQGESRFRYASTGGWTLGREPNGGAYFNRFPVVALTEPQEAVAVKVARNTYRPCCDNSTFFQDCNHGSALLGMLMLGASQGLREAELYRESLTFNSFWFPEQYVSMAVYFEAVTGTAWRDVDARAAMGSDFSSASGWRANIARELQARGLLLRPRGGGDCSA